MLIEPKKTQKKRILSVLLRLFLSKSVLFELTKLPAKPNRINVFIYFPAFSKNTVGVPDHPPHQGTAQDSGNRQYILF